MLADAGIGLTAVSTSSDDEVWTLRLPRRLDAKLWPSILLTLLWRLWDARNGEVFRGEQTSTVKILTRVTEDLAVWKKRLVLKKAGTADSIHAWQMYLSECKLSAHVPPMLSVTTV